MGLYTMELLELMGSVSYGQKIIKLGEKKGYIKRVRNIKPDRKGNYLVVNHISLQRASSLSVMNSAAAADITVVTITISD